MAPRAATLSKIIQLVGQDIITVKDVRDAWPSHVRAGLTDGYVDVSIHVGPIGLSQRGRDDVERRFQNPGKDRPIIVLAGTIPLLVGLWEAGPKPVLVAMGDVMKRVGLPTRQSLFIPLWLLEQAAKVGWAEHQSTSYERLTAFHPKFLPIYIEMVARKIFLPPDRVMNAVDAAGFNEQIPVQPPERARRAVSALVRSEKFRRQVVDAYGGRCAMCGMNLGLVEGAHIYPASAPSSPDEVWNGLALCNNHHGAFDKHFIWIAPDSMEIRLDPRVVADAAKRPVCKRFIETTFATLSLPQSRELYPRPDMLEKRYEYFEAHYAWARAS